MVWLNTDCYNVDVPRGSFGGARCTCSACNKHNVPYTIAQEESFVDKINTDKDELTVDIIVTYKGKIMKNSVKLSGELIEDIGSLAALDMWWTKVKHKIAERMNQQHARAGGNYFLEKKNGTPSGVLEQ